MRTCYSLFLLSTAACVTSKSDHQGSDDAGGETPGTTPTTSTTETGDTGHSSAPLDVVAIGFEYIGGWDQENKLLEPYLYPDLNGTNQGSPFPASPWIRVVLADLEYFSTGGPDDPDNYCEFLAFFNQTPNDSLTGTTFDWDAGHGGTGVDLPTLAGFEGSLSINTSSLSDRCYDLDDYVFPGGTPTQTMDGMHFGLAIGPWSPYLYQNSYDYYGYTPPLTASLLTEFIAVNHPDGAGGFTFDAYDWDSALYVQEDYSQCLYYSTTGSGTYAFCGLVETTVDDAGNGIYVVGDTSVQPMHGYLAGNAYWFEDIPNLDLSILKDGVP